MQQSLIGLGNATSGSKVVSENLELSGRRRRAAMLQIQAADANEIPAHIITAINEGRLKLMDKTHRFTKLVNGSIVKMLEPKDTRVIGVQSIDKNRITGENAFFLTGIKVTLAYATAILDDAGAVETIAKDVPLHSLSFKPIDFGTYEPRLLVSDGGEVVTIAPGDTLPSGATPLGVTNQYEEWFPGMQNGELSLIVNNAKNIVSELNLAAFCNNNGTFHLDNSRVLTPDQTIDLKLDFENADNIPDGQDEAYFVTVELEGCELVARG